MNHSVEKHESIEALLSNTIPRASEAFENQLAEKLFDPLGTTFKPKHERRNASSMLQRYRIWALGAAALAVLLLVLFMIPATRSAAKEVLLGFTRAIHEIVPVDFLVIESEMEGAAIPEDIEVTTIEEASERISFQVRVPDFLPEGYRLEKIWAAKGGAGVGLWYRGSGYGYISIDQYDPQRTNLVTECASVSVDVNATVDEGDVVAEEIENETEAEADSCGELGGIGVDAEIMDIQIGDVVGQLVIGGWNVIPKETEPQKANPGETVTYNFMWDPDRPEYQLRWESDGIAYAVQIYDRNITIDEIITFANSFR